MQTSQQARFAAYVGAFPVQVQPHDTGLYFDLISKPDVLPM